MTEQQMILGLQAGDERALNAAMDAYSRLLWSIARSVLRNVGTGEDMEECVADAFIQLWRNSDAITDSRGSVKCWLCTVTKCKAIDRYRSIARGRDILLNEEIASLSVGVFDQPLNAVLQRELLAAVHTLGEPDQEILLRRYYYQQKPKDIAIAVDLSVKQVENRLFRAKQLLRKQLEGEMI